MTASLSNSSLQTVKPSFNSTFETKAVENGYSLAMNNQTHLCSRAGSYRNIATKYVAHIDEFFSTRKQVVNSVSTFIDRIRDQADEINIHAHNRAYDANSSTVKIIRQLAFIKQVLPGELSNEFDRSYDHMNLNAHEKTLQSQLMKKACDDNYLMGKLSENFKAV